MSYQDKAREILKSKGFINDFAVDELTRLFKEEVEKIILMAYDVKAGTPLISKEKALKYKIVQAQRARLNKTIEGEAPNPN